LKCLRNRFGERYPSEAFSWLSSRAGGFGEAVEAVFKDEVDGVGGGLSSLGRFYRRDVALVFSCFL